MIPAARPRPALAWALLLACHGCPPGTDDDDATTPPCDNQDAPEVLVQAIEDGQPAGFPVQVLAQVTDADGISTVSLYYRTTGLPGFTFDFMSNEGTGDPTVYAGEIPASVVQDPGVDFYVRATDSVSGCQEEAFAPEEAPEQWYAFTARLDLLPLPFYEFFDPDSGCGADGADLSDLGWEVAIEDFVEGIHAFRLSDRSALSGGCGVYHSEGIPGGFWECPPPDGAGSIRRDNWLITPPLDLSGKTDLAVRWFERHVPAGICTETHGLFVSTGAPDPAAGEYVPVAEALPFPGSAWQGSGWYDLSQFAGAERAYVALRYTGGAAGAWYVDDFYVGEPLADLVLEQAGPLAADVGPGSAGVELAVSIRNTSAEYGADELTATLTSADPALTISTPGSTVPALGPGQVATAATPFVFSVGAAHADNAWLDFALTLTDGAGHHWTVPIRLLMGEPSTVQVEFSAPGDAGLALELGHGSPDEPDFAIAADAASLAAGLWTVDVTGEAAALPPGPGSRRWYLEAAASGTTASILEDFVFVVGGQEYRPDPSEVPTVLSPPVQVVVQVPPPPRLVVDGWTSDPDPPAPGGSVALSDLVLRNDGWPTAGPVGCVIGSTHPDATGFSSSPVTFGDDPIGTGESRTADGPFGLTIAGTHLDDSPIPLTLLCTDGADTLVHLFDLPVPYAHPALQSFRVDDEDCQECDEDGLADPEETVFVHVTAANDGSFATSGPLTAGVIDTATGTATDYSFVPGTLEFGPDPLDPSQAVESTNGFEVTLGPDARLGDSIVLLLSFHSGTDNWNEEMVLEVTGLPWTDCPGGEDAQGDPVNGYAFDVRGCAFRSDDRFVQVRLDSWTPFDPATLFVDFFFYEVPALYSIETVGLSADFESGCVWGDNLVPTEPIVVAADADSVTARILLDDMEVLADNTQVAFGAGSCPDIYFCDTFPEGVLLFNIAEGTYWCEGSGFLNLSW